MSVGQKSRCTTFRTEAETLLIFNNGTPLLQYGLLTAGGQEIGGSIPTNILEAMEVIGDFGDCCCNDLRDMLDEVWKTE